MPEVVSEFVDSGNYLNAYSIIRDIIESEKADVNKYNQGSEVNKIDMCFTSIPPQLSCTNKRFTYSRLDNGQSRTSARRYSDNLLWVVRAGIANPCYSLRSPEIPLISFRNLDIFKVYLSDTGMLSYMLGREAQTALLREDYSINEGAVAENIVAECLMKSGHPCYYYRKSKGPDMMEIDFVLELGLELAVIEVKSGKDREAPSIGKFDRFHRVGRKIMFYKGNIKEENGIEMYPLFAAAFINDMVRPSDSPFMETPDNSFIIPGHSTSEE